MKKVILLMALLACFMFAAAPAFADFSDVKTTDASCTPSGASGSFLGIIVVTDGTNSVTIDIYDNTAGSGTKLIPTWVVTTSGSNRVQAIGFDAGDVRYHNGIYVDVTTSGTVSYMVYFTQR